MLMRKGCNGALFKIGIFFANFKKAVMKARPEVFHEGLRPNKIVEFN